MTFHLMPPQLNEGATLELELGDEHAENLCGFVRAGAFYALFKLLTVAELAGPARALEWGEALLEDDELLAAFASCTCARSMGVRDEDAGDDSEA